MDAGLFEELKADLDVFLGRFGGCFRRRDGQAIPADAVRELISDKNAGNRAARRKFGHAGDGIALARAVIPSIGTTSAAEGN